MLLANLLRTLSQVEIEKIRQDFRLSERSRLLFERIAAAPSSPPATNQLCKIFHIKTENLYRLFSEIVEECVRILAPKEEFATLKFFQGKFLYRPFITEAQRIEKRLLYEKNKNALERYYKYLFLNIISFPIGLIDLDLMEEYGNKWHNSKDNPDVDDALYFRVKMIFYRIAALPTKKKMNLAQMSTYSRQLLDEVSEQAVASPNPNVQFEYFQAEWKACIYQRTDSVTQHRWLERSLAIVQENRSAFEANLEQIIELQIANEQAMFFGNAKEALQTFLKYYKGQTPETSRGALYLMRFTRVAFLAKDFQTAHKILSEFRSHQIVNVTRSLFITSLILKTLLEIGEGYVGAAAETIEILKSKNREKFFLAYEVQIRGLESVNAFKQDDFALADQLVERNIKWLRSRRISLSTSAWIYFYQIIGEIIRYKMTGEPIGTSLLNHFKNDFRTEHPEFFILLETEVKNAAPAKI